MSDEQIVAGPVIAVENSGFFKGLNKYVSIISIAIAGLFLLWVAVAKDVTLNPGTDDEKIVNQAAHILGKIQGGFNNNFGGWYLYVSAFYLIICLSLAVWPKAARIKLGGPDEKPEFSRFSWFSMMFGAGLGVGMLTYAVGEPIYHFMDNPDVIKGTAQGISESNVRPAFKWTLLHYGLTAWGIYGLVGLGLAYFAYNRKMPLTIRSGLTPLFGKSLSGPLGHAVDITAIIATITGVGYTIALGVKQFAFGLHNVTGADWIVPKGGSDPTNLAVLMCLAIIAVASTLSAISGVGKGIKWLSNINMGLSLFLLLFFAVFGIGSGALLFAFKHYFIAIWDYVIALPSMSLTVYSDGASTVASDGTTECLDKMCELTAWQGPWTILYWAWWIAFAPFVGLFLARVSRGRSIREFVLGAMFAPALMCLVWFALAGGSAIFAELNQGADGAILNANLSDMLFETINTILSSGSIGALLMSAIVVILLITYLVTSADSAILVITTIASGGRSTRRLLKHIIFWGGLLALVVGTLLVAGGLNALRAAMLIGALPFSVVVALMGISLVKDLIQRKPTQ
ncbi:MAG: BCCT family transporter [Hellea sp.]|nr:BCCT family transporter [Hellea sp.]